MKSEERNNTKNNNIKSNQENSNNATANSGQHRREKRQGPGRQMMLVGLVVLVIAVFAAVFIVHRYAPSQEKMSLQTYFGLKNDTDCAVITDGNYESPAEGDAADACLQNGAVYIKLSYLKNKIDDGYVYDSGENILRYATDSQLITATLNSSDYTVDRQQESNAVPVVIAENQTVYINLDWVKNFTDLSYQKFENPNRITIEKAGWKRTRAAVAADGQVRRNGGVKAPVLSTVKKGESVTVLEDYGTWSKVLTGKAVVGCIQNRRLKDQKTSKVKAQLAKRTYNHIKMNKEVNLGWHQVTSKAGNSSLTSTLANTKGLNVISPTWYLLSDNQGSISDYSSADYVNQCHQNQIQVWALVSNLGDQNVDTTAVLNTTSSRDNLVNQLIASAITSNADGINVDFEALSGDAKDGYIQFIKELSLKCEKNDLILSVDNYAPSGSSEMYQRKIQAEYADYLILMGYDEHYSGSKEAGSVASIDWVKKGIKKTLEDVPAEQLILGMPFFTRVWSTDADGTVKSDALGMQDALNYMQENQATITWSDTYGQNYGTFTKDNKKYECWLEDDKSLSLKLQAMEDNKLAGGAFWKMGFEPASIWDTVAKYIGN